MLKTHPGSFDHAQIARCHLALQAAHHSRALDKGALIGGVLSRLLRVPRVFDVQGSLTSEKADH
jgi:hypothetical protein